MFKIHQYNQVQQLEISLNSNSVVVQPEISAFIHGHITITNKTLPFKDRVKSHFIGKQYYKLIYTGIGQIYSKASIKCFHRIILENETIILTGNTFCAASEQLQVFPKLTLSITNQLTGIPMVHNHVQGNGELIIKAPGPVKTLVLTNDKFIATGNILARSDSLHYSRETLSKHSGIQENNKLAHVFRGTGKIFFTPTPNKNILLTS